MARICIDPGHDGVVDPGAVGPVGTTEAEVTLAISFSLQRLLEEAGHEVLLTRTGPDPNVYELGPRVAASNDWGADLFVSIHCNSFSNPAAHGVETWYAANSVHGMAAAQAVQQQLVATLGLTDRGIKSTAQQRLYVLLNTAAPAILVEVAFISNPQEELQLAMPEWQQQAAIAIFQGVSQVVG